MSQPDAVTGGERLLQAFECAGKWLQAQRLPDGRRLLLQLEGECSQFVRFNQGRVRQIGQVDTRQWNLTLIEARTGGHAQVMCSFTDAARGPDRAQADDLLWALCDAQLAMLGTLIGQAPIDPLLLVDDHPSHSESMLAGQLPVLDEMVDVIVQASRPAIDLVGFLACGPQISGLLSSLGHRHLQWRESWFFDFSVYVGVPAAIKPVAWRDKAVKRTLAARDWDPGTVTAAIAEAAGQVQVLTRPARRLAPGAYRAWLAPAAMGDLLGMFGWGAFSLQQLRRGGSALERAYGGMSAPSPEASGEQAPVLFSPLVQLSDAPGLAGVPRFQSQGLVGPAQLDLISGGRVRSTLVSPRSAREFGVSHNGYDSGESPRALSLAAGHLPPEQVLQALGTGLYISNLWYLNFSDRLSCSVTGMTRFASMWVEEGQIVAPLEAMRIDDSLYQLLGPQLEALGKQVHWLPDVSTYSQRSFGGCATPGALVRQLQLAL